MASEAPIDIKAPTASADSLSKALGALFDEETQYLDYLRKGRKRNFFVTAVSDSKTTVLKPVPKVIQVEGETKFNWLKTALCTLGLPVVARAFAAMTPYLVLGGLGAGLGFLKTKELEYEKKQDERLLHAEVRNSDRNNLKGEKEDTYTVEDAQKNLDASKKGIFHMIGEGLSDITGFDGGGVVKGATKSVVAEAGVPEWVVPFVKLGEIIKNTAYDPIGSLMVGAAASLLDIIPLGDSKSSLRVAIASLKAQFGMEVFKPEIRGSAGGVTHIQPGLRVVTNSFMFFISNFFGTAARAAASRRTTQEDPNNPRNTNAARGEVVNFNLNQEAAFKKIYDIAVAVGGPKFPELVAAIAMHETGFLTVVGGNNPFNQRATDGSFINYSSLEEATREHIAFWHEASRHKNNANNFSDPNTAFAHLVYDYAPPADNNDPTSYKQSVANMIATLLPKVKGQKPTTPPKTNNKILSPAKWTEISEKIEKWKKNPGAYINNQKVQVPGLGTVLVGTEGHWPMHKPVIKYFDPTGKPMTEREWMDEFNRLNPQNQQSQSGSQSGAPHVGGPDLSPNKSAPSLNPVTSQKDTMDLNFSVETRDERAMETVEQNSISFVPILIPGQVIEQVQMIPIESMTKKDVSYIDPFSHGVKRGSKKFL